MDIDALSDRIAELETRLRRWLIVAGVLFMVLVVGAALAWKRLSEPQELRLHTLRIVDANGVERVRIGGELPDAIINGQRVPRGEQAAGVLLYDDTGQERGGYVTFSPSRNVALTLDTREGQVALFAAGPDDGAVARLWHGKGEDWIEMRADGAGTRLTVGLGNEVVLQRPPMSEADVAVVCSGLKQEIEKITPRPPVEEVLRACKQRVPEDVCRSCLGLR